ncbi:MAG: phage tail protein [Steroidobacteraceae bacterium]
MSEPYIGEVRMVGFNFAPAGWALCNGQLLSIEQNTALFSILGTTYGGNGTTDFALPDLRGRVPAHVGPDLFLGEPDGEETVALTTQQIPAHRHLVGSVGQANSDIPTGNVFAAPRRGINVYALPPANVAINSQDVVGGNVPHDNLQPYLVVNFIIALEGVFPSRN